LIVTGPFMDEAEAAALNELAAPLVGRGLVELATFVPALAGTLARADVVVAMAGYNTVCEILSFRRAAVLVPRVRPRQEQLLRAEALARRGLVRMIHPDKLEPGRLLETVVEVMAHPSRPHRPVDLGGLQNAAHELELLVRDTAAGRLDAVASARSAP
jgi:predicted glycosyltransferase